MNPMWAIEDEIKLIEKLEEDNVIVTPGDVVTILRKLDDPDDPDQEYFRELISA